MPKRIRRNITLALVIFLAACAPTSDWQPLRCGLWLHKNGDIGFKVTENFDDGKRQTHYLTQLCCDGLELKNMVDTSTFHPIGDELYRDKNHTYRHLLRADGGALIIE